MWPSHSSPYGAEIAYSAIGPPSAFPYPYALDHHRPPPRDLRPQFRRQRRVTVRLITRVFRQVLPNARQRLVEAPQFKPVVQQSHFSFRVADQVFIAQFVDPSRRQQPFALLQLRVQAVERPENVFLQAGERGRLQAVVAVQRFPQVHRGREHREGVADDVDEAGVGEQIQQRLDAAAVRRRLEDEAARVRERQAAQKVQERPLPAGPGAGRQPFQVEGVLVLRRVVGEGDGQVRRRLAEHRQGEFVLLRLVVAGRHVVHRPARRHEEPEQAREGLLGEQEMVRRQTLVRRGEGVARVEDEQFMEERRSGAPVTDDEQRRLADGRAGDGAAVQGFGQHAQHTVHDAGGAGDRGDVPVGWLDGEVVADEQAHPGEQVHAMPEAGGPLRLGRGRGGRHGVLGLTPTRSASEGSCRNLACASGWCGRCVGQTVILAGWEGPARADFSPGLLTGVGVWGIE